MEWLIETSAGGGGGRGVTLVSRITLPVPSNLNSSHTRSSSGISSSSSNSSNSSGGGGGGGAGDILQLQQQNQVQRGIVVNGVASSSWLEWLATPSLLQVVKQSPTKAKREQSEEYSAFSIHHSAFNCQPACVGLVFTL